MIIFNNLKSFLLIILTLGFLQLFSQEDDEPTEVDTLRFHEVIDVEDFKDALFNEIILFEINKYRKIRGLDSIVSNPILKNSAEDQSEYMSEIEDAIEFQTGKKKDLRSRLIYFGGSGVGNELIAKSSAKKGAETMSYKQLADEIFYKWVGNGKTALI
ncbi:MAG: hypothetical protein ABIJ97_05175, partial [Bacteroidota bacterium]